MRAGQYNRVNPILNACADFRSIQAAGIGPHNVISVGLDPGADLLDDSERLWERLQAKLHVARALAVLHVAPVEEMPGIEARNPGVLFCPGKVSANRR